MEPNKVIELPTKGLRLEIYDSVIILRSDEDMRVLSSAVKNGGLCTSKNILNMSVRWMYYSPTPEKEIERYEEVFGVDDIVGMMTAADVKKAVVRHQEGVTVVATAGVSNAASPGEEVEIWHNGTINIIVVVENKLKDEALANSIITITEAKTQVFNMLDIRSVNSGMPATGTTTDCVAVASLGRG
ncbi:MAG TPA: adenosylcobinamide amidohydrolase, partial [Candidatus Methanofastidiosa archaeon]|nr:adenosylcobinamide amidohydrolase [Candidatus Methanofastidiosa archaeon]